MSKIAAVGLDLAKNVFQAHGADASGVVLHKWLRSDHVLAFFGQLPRCVVAMEACGAPTSGAARSTSWAVGCC
jgi:transposase